jgi:hypothetical protein
VLAVLATTTVVAGACGDGPEQPRLLVDGSRARAASIQLEGVDEPVLQTKLRLVTARSVRTGSPLDDCLHDNWSATPAGLIVHRIGTDGESAAFLDRSRRALMACDGARGAAGRQWCGHTHGRLARGRLFDPRLSLGGCSTVSGLAVAFVWITPGPHTRYVVVERRGFSESYETAAGLPVRVAATERVDSVRSSAIVEVSEHAPDGRRLRWYEVEAHVAG